MDIKEFREKYPQYKAVDDKTLADALYSKYYDGKVDRAEFDGSFLGVKGASPSPNSDLGQDANIESVQAQQYQSQPTTSVANLSGSTSSQIEPSAMPTQEAQPLPTEGTQYLSKYSFRAAKPKEQQAADRWYTNLILNTKGEREAPGEAQEPWIDPVSAIAGGYGAGAKAAAKATLATPVKAIVGMFSKKAIASGLASAIPSGAMEIPIGQLSEMADENESAALAFIVSVGGGIVSGMTIESAIEKRLLARASQLASKFSDNPKIAKAAQELGISPAKIESAAQKGIISEGFAPPKTVPEGATETGGIIHEPGLTEEIAAKKAALNEPEIKEKELENAESIRKDEGQVQGRGDVGPSGEEKGGQDLQQQPPKETGYAEKQIEKESDLEKLRKESDVKMSQKIAEEGQAGEIRLPEKKAHGYEFEDEKLEKRWQRAHGMRQETLREKIKETLVGIKHKLTREYENLPKNEEFAEASFALRKLAKQKEVQGDRAVRDIKNITADLDEREFDIFERHQILKDFEETASDNERLQSRINPKAAKKGPQKVAEKKLPFGLNLEKVKKELSRIEPEVAKSEKIRGAINRRKQFWSELKKEYHSSMRGAGFNVGERLSRESYFRHQVLEYVQLNGIFGTGKKLKTPTSSGYLRKRAGSEKAINTSYLEAENEVVAQMLYDIQVAKTIKRIKDNYDIYDEVKKTIPKGKKLKDVIPKGYSEWRPREGNVFYMADTVPGRVASELLEGAMEKMEITAKDLRKALAIGGKHKPMIIKDELASTLNELTKERSQNPIAKAHRELLKKWKVWQLISPRRFVKYNLRNISGDIDAVFAGNPSSLKKVPSAVKDLYDAFINKKMSPDLQDFFDRGGMSSTLQAQEMGSIQQLKIFRDMIQSKGNVSEIPKKIWQKYWSVARMSTDFRESILRYAAYLDFKGKMEASPDGLPDKYAASMREEVSGLSDIKDRAYLMQNDLLGAYDRVSVAGKALREQMIPFWSWKEANAKRYYRMISNAAKDNTLTSTLGRKIGATTTFKAMRIGSFLLKASALWGMLQFWNMVVHGEEEEALPEGVKQKPHIIFGRDKDGNIEYFSRLGSVPDLLEWFGLDAAPSQIERLVAGESPTVIAKEMAKAPVNVIAGGVVPFEKLALEIASQRSLYPDIFKPMTIRDRGLHIARHFGVENEYSEIMNLPKRPYSESLVRSAIYKIDPEQAAYSDIYEMKNRYMKKIGKFGEGFWLTEKGSTLYNLKLALRYGDKKAADKYFDSYMIDHKGTLVDLLKNTLNMSPLSGMTLAEKLVFQRQLSEDDKEKLALATTYDRRLMAYLSKYLSERMAKK